MSHHSPRYQSETMGSHWRREVQDNHQGRHPRNLHKEIQRLNHLLEVERARRFEENRRLARLEEELEEMKVHLNRQTDVKEMLISQAENARSELDRLERYSDPEVVKAVIIASQAYQDVKDMEMKHLQQVYVDLRVAHLLSQEAFVSEIQEEKAKSKALQEELEELETYYEEQSSKYEGDNALVRQEGETQTFNEEQLSEEQKSQKITCIQDTEKLLQDELTQLKISYDELQYKYGSDIFELTEDVERYQEEIEQVENALSKEKRENLIHKINYSALEDRVEKLIFQISQERKTRLKKSEEDAEFIQTMRAENAVFQEKWRKETLFLQDGKKRLEEELFYVKRSYNELKCEYDSNVSRLKRDRERYRQKMEQEEAALSKEKQEKIILERQYSELQHQVEKLNLEIIQERERRMEKTEEDKVLLENTRAENAVLLDKTRKEVQLLLDRERSAQAELEKMNGLYVELKSRYDTEVTALKHQAEKYQEEIITVKKDLERVREELLLADTLTDEEDFQQTDVDVFQEEEDLQRQVELIKVLSPQVSPGTSKETKIAGESVLENLDHPDTKPMKDDKKGKSKTSFWQKLRNMLRLKKPKKKQKGKDDINI
ncbi:interactor of constitutive active ROPs 5-like isoform X2 [Gambusia affinis]|uniref:interactor of constitutive active ROPs 5-like isoform X2 n=1 Tax=Gambusia affinis TaxID=33528 RepID=UPI001CDC89E5|nr:interactor of constitutive active ROPs 5-like isoform X2 [Gambusia affinis]